ncbi:hypothetical protein LPTSP3_g10220 [Leptospira kobayashii]|uniref:Lipoprotein n=1 Tax=Leptospira kobayashii TaxID=1917830 RepID=A0ABN6KAX5_9LEPT|nr:hypothetical protein [Leptospira kobayashii]BDA78092.1 hypothetical protein LPTSP3_g10220 [Leptospira kobayashii]
MKSKFSFLLLILFLIFEINSCATGVQSRNLMFRNNEFAIYSVKRENIKLKSEKNLEQSFAHPIEISEDKILDILGNIRYKQESSYGSLLLYVFEEAEIKDFSADLMDGLRKVKPDQMLLIVSKYNPVKSVVSHYVRTGFYIWATENTIEILVGEIQSEIAFDEQGNYYDWSKIPDISFDHTPETNFILPGAGFTFKEVDGFRNRRWLVFGKKDLSKLKFEKRKVKSAKEIITSVDSDLTPEKRINRDEDDSVLPD